MLHDKFQFMGKITDKQHDSTSALRFVVKKLDDAYAVFQNDRPIARGFYCEHLVWRWLNEWTTSQASLPKSLTIRCVVISIAVTHVFMWMLLFGTDVRIWLARGLFWFVPFAFCAGAGAAAGKAARPSCKSCRSREAGRRGEDDPFQFTETGAYLKNRFMKRTHN